MKRVLVSWSSGKDSAWTLHRLRSRADCHVVGLLTTVNRSMRRVAMHGVREELLEAQAVRVGLPLLKVEIPERCSNRTYEDAMTAACEQARRSDVDAIAFGDLFLADIRQYRIGQMQKTGLEPLFPLWGLRTDLLAQEMLAAGLAARITCIDPNKLASTFAGRTFDRQLVAELPEGIDPCGERGEFHTFVHDGPMFSHPIPLHVGDVVERGGFWFADLLPGVPTPVEAGP